MKIHNFEETFNCCLIYSYLYQHSRILMHQEDPLEIFYEVPLVQVCEVAPERPAENLRRQASHGRALFPQCAYRAKAVGDVAG